MARLGDDLLDEMGLPLSGRSICAGVEVQVYGKATVRNELFSAELSLDGNCRSFSGVFSMAITARENRLTEFYVVPPNVVKNFI